MTSLSGWQFWVDRGGTFTDVVAKRPDGALLTHKLLSDNPEQYRDAALHAIRTLLGLARDAQIPAALTSINTSSSASSGSGKSL